MFERNVTVYCASSDKVNEKYLSAAEQLGCLLARAGIGIVYGGGKAGLMGRLANGALAEGGKVTGVIPQFMMDIELGHEEVTRLDIVENMHIRQQRMIHLSDAFITLPGGSGSMLEFLEVVSWKRLGLLISPAFLVNIAGYYDPLIAMLNRCISEKFMAEDYYKIWNITSTVEETVEAIIRLFPQPERLFEPNLINE